MVKGTIKTKDKTLEVHLFENAMIEIESKLHENLGIEVRRVDPTDMYGQIGPKGALYMIRVYKPEPNVKELPDGYDSAWIMPDGKIIKRGEKY